MQRNAAVSIPSKNCPPPPKILAPKKIALTEGAPVKSVSFYKIYQLYDGGFVYWQIIKMKF